MTLNLKTVNQSSCMTLWPMMLNHHAKFDYRRFSSWGDIIKMNIHWDSEPFCDLDLDHNKAIQSFHKTTLHLMMMCHQTKFSCKKFSSSDNILKSHVLIILSLTVTLTLKRENQSFWSTIWLIMIHHIPSLVVKGSAFQKISSGQTFTDILNLCCDLDLECRNPIFQKDTLAYDVVL